MHKIAPSLRPKLHGTKISHTHRRRTEKQKQKTRTFLRLSSSYTHEPKQSSRGQPYNHDHPRQDHAERPEREDVEYQDQKAQRTAGARVIRRIKSASRGFDRQKNGEEEKSVNYGVFL